MLLYQQKLNNAENVPRYYESFKMLLNPMDYIYLFICSFNHSSKAFQKKRDLLTFRRRLLKKYIYLYIYRYIEH